MRHRVSRRFFAGAALAAWSALAPSVSAGPLELPVTPCLIVATPQSIKDPHVRFRGTAKGWTRAQMSATNLVFYAYPRGVVVGRAPLKPDIDSYFPVPDGTNAIGVQLRYDNRVVPTRPPMKDSINRYPVDRKTQHGWLFPPVRPTPGTYRMK
jgi:hypothetical protein